MLKSTGSVARVKPPRASCQRTVPALSMRASLSQTALAPIMPEPPDSSRAVPEMGFTPSRRKAVTGRVSRETGAKWSMVTFPSSPGGTGVVVVERLMLPAASVPAAKTR